MATSPATPTELQKATTDLVKAREESDTRAKEFEKAKEDHDKEIKKIEVERSTSSVFANLEAQVREARQLLETETKALGDLRDKAALLVKAAEEAKAAVACKSSQKQLDDARALRDAKEGEVTAAAGKATAADKLVTSTAATAAAAADAAKLTTASLAAAKAELDKAEKELKKHDDALKQFGPAEEAKLQEADRVLRKARMDSDLANKAYDRDVALARKKCAETIVDLRQQQQQSSKAEAS